MTLFGSKKVKVLNKSGCTEDSVEELPLEVVKTEDQKMLMTEKQKKS